MAWKHGTFRYTQTADLLWRDDLCNVRSCTSAVVKPARVHELLDPKSQSESLKATSVNSDPLSCFAMRIRPHKQTPSDGPAAEATSPSFRV